jgi:hypothetical protein
MKGLWNEIEATVAVHAAAYFLGSMRGSIVLCQIGMRALRQAVTILHVILKDEGHDRSIV